MKKEQNICNFVKSNPIPDDIQSTLSSKKGQGNKNAKGIVFALSSSHRTAGITLDRNQF